MDQPYQMSKKVVAMACGKQAGIAWLSRDHQIF